MTQSPVQFAVSEIAAARIPGQFKMTIDPDRQLVRHEVVAWSVGLKWVTFYYYNKVMDPTSPSFLAGRDDEYLETVEQPVMDDWMQGIQSHHMATHEAALLHGLEPGGRSDLPVERVMIDRLLKAMVEGQRIDMHGPAQTLASFDDYIQFLANNLEYMGTYVGERHFQLRQLGLDLPVLSTWMPLGNATYCGHALDLDHQLPQTLCAGVVGRRLGDLVGTGSAELDARIVTEVLTSQDLLMDHWPTSTQTRLCLEPDLVELGP